MKRISNLLLAFVLPCLILAGCDKGSDDPPYNITVSNDGNGTATTSKATAKEGATVSINATPAEGYAFVRWTTVSGDVQFKPDAITNPATFRMPATDVSIMAEFAEEQIIISNPSQKTQTAFADEQATGGFTFTAKSDWTATIMEMETPASIRTATMAYASAVPWLRLLLDGEETHSGGMGQFSLSIELDPNYTGETRSAMITITCGDMSISISITQSGTTESGEVPEPKYTVGITGDGNGTGTATVGNKTITQAGAGETVTLTATPETGYVFSKWIVLSGDVTFTPNAMINPVTFTMPTENVNIKAEFVKPEYTVTITNSVGGTTSSKTENVTDPYHKSEEGKTVTIIAEAESGYEFDKWIVVSGGDITITPYYTTDNLTVATFTMPARDVSVMAEFKQISHSQTDYYGQWVMWEGGVNGDWAHHVNINENKCFIEFASGVGGGGIGFEDLTWIPVTNSEGSYTDDYPTGFKIIGTLLYNTSDNLPKADGSGLAAIGDQVAWWWYMSKDGQSLRAGNINAPHASTGPYIK